MSKLIIIRGNSGSGKTTVAKELQKRLGRNTMLISHDMIRIQMLNAKDPEALPLITELLKYGRNHSDITILEGILPADVYKPLFDTAVAVYGANIYAFYYDLTFEETLSRHSTKPNREDFGEREMRRWWREKDYIGTIHETAISAEMSESHTVKIICSAVEDT